MEKFDRNVYQNLESYTAFINEGILEIRGLDQKEIEQLRLLALEEINHPNVLEITPDRCESTLLQKLGGIIKAVRVGGELCAFTAMVIGGVLKSRYPQKTDIRITAKSLCGLDRQSESIFLIQKSFADFPELGLDERSIENINKIKQAYRYGYQYEKEYRGCAQCAIAGVSKVTGKENLEMFRAANGFAAGMGLLGDGVCGGYSGGVLSMGLFAGRRFEFFDADKEQKDLCGELVKKLHDRFIEVYGSVICHEIHKDIFGRAFHITQVGEKEAFEDAGAHTLDKCTAVVGFAAATTVEILLAKNLI